MTLRRPDPRALLEAAYHAALAATRPGLLTRAHLPAAPPHALLALGKAAPAMLGAAQEAFPGLPSLAILPPGLEIAAGPQLRVMVGGHPVPDAGSVQAAEAALALASGLGADQHLLVLVSGGGSALMSAPWGVTLEQKQALTRALLASGAGIQELNTVRAHLSRVKGGRLAGATRARVTGLLLSDVVGNDPAIIASGPTVAAPGSFADALAVLDSYHIDAPEARAHLTRGIRGERSERFSEVQTRQNTTATSSFGGWRVPLRHNNDIILANAPGAAEVPGQRITNTVIGSGELMITAARHFLATQGVQAVSLGELTGEAGEVAPKVAERLRQARQRGGKTGGPQVLLWGGEMTVTLGHTYGLGGRNQEFALALLLALGEEGAYGLFAGSDGQDGNSGAAGAFITPDTLERARQLGQDAAHSLARHDSGSFFAALGDQLVTGPSGTNLNDFAAVWLEN